MLICVSIDPVAIILLACGPCEVILNYLGQVLYLGRAPRTKETLPDFHEWCQVTRHPRLFSRLTGFNGHPGFEASQEKGEKRLRLGKDQVLGGVSSHFLLFCDQAT